MIMPTLYLGIATSLAHRKMFKIQLKMSSELGTCGFA